MMPLQRPISLAVIAKEQRERKKKRIDKFVLSLMPLYADIVHYKNYSLFVVKKAKEIITYIDNELNNE